MTGRGGSGDEGGSGSAHGRAPEGACDAGQLTEADLSDIREALDRTNDTFGASALERSSLLAVESACDDAMWSALEEAELAMDEVSGIARSWLSRRTLRGSSTLILSPRVPFRYWLGANTAKYPRFSEHLLAIANLRRLLEDISYRMASAEESSE